MTDKRKLSHKLLSIFLSIALLLSCLPISMSAAAALDTTRTADPSTMDSWKNYFPSGDDLNTENAGGVWTDKSVFTDASAFQSYGINLKENDNMLVALSAIASNMSVTGMSSVATDTMLVLDVSGSMGPGYNNVATALVDAANASLDTLLENSNNKVGVVLYSNTVLTLLPLNNYQKTASGKYLTIDNNNISIDSTLRTAEGGLPYTGYNAPSKNVSGATYIQAGIMDALAEFTASSNNPTESSITRKPVMVLMTDGAPTYGSSNVKSLNRDMGTGGSSTTGLGFVTQLTAAYAKNQIKARYNSDCLFYTLGLAIGNGTTSDESDVAIATSVLDPKVGDATDDLWIRWDDASLNDTIQVQRRNYLYNLGNEYVTKTNDTYTRDYVDGYFNSDDYTDPQNGTLADALKKAFQAIVDEIALQSQYFPTLIEGDENLSGYVSFVDQIGKYMEVKDIKGLTIGDNTLFSGADLASNFVEGGGNLGTTANPTELGDNLVWAVMERIGLATADEARTLIGLAYQNGQLYYNNANDFSNYIGWYANAAGKFLGFWHEGTTTMPNPTDPNLTDETRPYYIMKSYGYLGEVNTHAKSDMMYATIQVRERISDGDQTVSFAIPAGLIPTITYKVTLDEASNLTDLVATGATAPIRLVYEVGLKDKINEYNVKDIISAEYLEANTNPDGSINFYTNQYEADNTTGYGKVNTYSYFRPSKENDRYYFQNDSRIYTLNGDNYEVYTGSTHPKDAGINLYRKHAVYVKNGSLTTRINYNQLSTAILEDAQLISGEWVIKGGHVRLNYANYTIYKGGTNTEVPDDNKTGSLKYANQPFIDVYNTNSNDVDHRFVVGATLGNNGRITLNPETGIKLTKKLAEGATPTDKEFTFKLTNTTDANDNAEYPVYKTNADGSVDTAVTSVKFTSGTASVLLSPGEALYIGGMTAGESFKIEEVADRDYIVESVNGNKTQDASVTIVVQKLEAADFVNTDRGTGNLTVAKEVAHPYGTSYTLPDKSFNITVKLEGVGTANETFNAIFTNAANVSNNTTVTTVDGQLNYTLKHNEQLNILNLPAGTEATVTESNPGTGFTPQYWDNGALGDGQITVNQNETASVIVLNDYKAVNNVSPNIVVSGRKNLDSETLFTGSFEFKLQRYNAETTNWDTIGDAKTVSYDDEKGIKNFSFETALNSEVYDSIGTYYYRVVETVGNNPQMVYDTNIHSFYINVTDADMDGSLEINPQNGVATTRNNVVSITPGTPWNVVTDFTNTYQNENTANVTIDVEKAVTNLSESAIGTNLEGFEFVLEGDATTASPTPITLKTNARGALRFTLNYKASDLGVDDTKTFNYTLKEKLPNGYVNSSGVWNYDDTVLNVKVVLTLNPDGTITAVVTDDGTNTSNADNAITANFTNVYTPKTAVLPLDFIDKNLTGRELNPNEFEFAIYNFDDTAFTNPLATGKNNAAGDVIFNAPLTFDKVGIYFYNVKETSESKDGVKVDGNVYRVTVTVTDIDGQLTASYALINDASTVTFNNTYTALPVSVTITANKVLTGRALLNDEFTFVMQESDQNGNATPGGKVYTAKNSTGGVSNISFPAISYTATGTYYYVVSEQDTAGEPTYGITYDAKEYIVKIVVKDNLLGELVAENPVYSLKGNGPANAILFQNQYNALPTSATLSGSKVLTGKLLGGGDFSFNLLASDSSWNEGKLLETKSNGADGTFTFKKLDFETVGTHYYLVKEENAGQTIKGVTYDDIVYRVKIEVFDNLRGNLYTAVTITDDVDIPQVNITFNNAYAVTGNANVTLEGQKFLQGRDIRDGEFTFELYETADNTYDITDVTPNTDTNENDKFEFALQYEPEDIGKTFYYLVKEKNAGETIKGIYHDTTQYKISVKVEDNTEGGIKTTVTVNDGSVLPTALNFNNTFTAGTSVEIGIDKTVNNLGSEEISAEGFNFSLEKVGTELNLKETTDADGKAKFVLIFNEKDAGNTYTYKLTEINDGRANVTYSTVAYEFKIKVELNDLDELVATVLQNEMPIENPIAVFVNEYDYTPPAPPTPPTSPQTGDLSNIHLWLALFFVSGSGIFATQVFKKRKSAEEK